MAISVARARWYRATSYIVRLLRIRKRWAATGRHLQRERVQDLLSGIERKRGVLVRTKPAVTRPFRDTTADGKLFNLTIFKCCARRQHRRD